MKAVNLKEYKQENTRWPIDCILENLDDYEEILIIAKKKGVDGFTRFSSQLKSTFWWVGCMDAVKRILLDESITEGEL